MITDPGDCYFYHTMDVPGYGHVEGEWDLRAGIRAYLGNVDFTGKRVLEIGTASGFLCFHMEREGAEVVGYDLSEDQDWDVVPYARYDHAQFLTERKEHIRRLNNGFWFCHRAFGSQSRMVYGDVYSVPEEIGGVDICTFGSILLHLRDPFLALQNALRLTRETVIVTDRFYESDVEDQPPRGTGNGDRQQVHRPHSALRTLARRVALTMPGIRNALAERDQLRSERTGLLQERDRLLKERTKLLRERDKFEFLPDWRASEPKETWWRLSPDVVSQFVGVLGFERTEVSYHSHKCRAGEAKLFTVVGHRTAPGYG